MGVSSLVEADMNGTRLVHITTVPLSLVAFYSGQVRYMRSRGLEVRAISSPGALLERFEAEEGIPVHAVPMDRRITPRRDLVALRRLYRRLRAIRPQIVHASTPKGGLLGMIAAWLARVPVRIYHVHGLPCLTASGHRRALLRLSERVACRLATRVLCVSHSIRAAAIAEGLCPAGKIAVPLAGSANGIDATGRFDPRRLGDQAGPATRRRFAIPADARVLGFVGRIVRDKGLVELAAAWRILREGYLDLHLLIAGPFEPHDPLPADVVEALRADPRVHLVGPVDDTPAFYAALDVVALPSYREGLPTVPLEAAAMELPVVATRIPGCVDAVQDDVTGTLVPARDAEALARAIAAYLDDPDLRRRHGRAGRERVLREFRQEEIWAAVYEEYARLLRARGPARQIGGGRPAAGILEGETP